MKPRVNLSTWKNSQAERRFRKTEDHYWHEFWPDPPESFDTETHLGPTRTYRWAGTGDPVVFLHGTGGTSIMWSEYIARLEGRTVYAIDTIGDVGRSEQRVAVEDAADYSRWLEEVLAGLEIEHAHLAGNSYGGFLALNLAARDPARVRSLTLLDPAGLVAVQMGRFLLWGFAVGLASLLPARPRRIAARRLRMPLLEDKAMMGLVRHAQLNHRTRLLRPEPLTDEQLRSIVVPVLLFVGEKSEVFPAREVVRRAEALPDVDIDLVAGAGHALPLSHTDHVVARMNDFLRRHAEAAPM